MSDTAPITKDEESGKFLPGNTWRYRPGDHGHVARYSYRSLSLTIREYLQDCLNTDKRYTWAGLAVYMGITRQGLDDYRKAKYKTNDKHKISAILDYYATHIEGQLEEKLTDRQFATSGVIRALEVLDRDKWGDNKKIDIDVKQQISISLDPDSALAKRLNGAGVTIDQHPEALEKPV